MRKRKVVCNVTWDMLVMALLLLTSIVAWRNVDFVKSNVSRSLIGIFVACAVTNSTVLFPASSVIVVLEFVRILNPMLVIIFGALGAATGEMVGFYVGRVGGRVIKSRRWAYLKKIVRKRPYFWIFTFSVLPVPIFDVIGILLGSTNMSAVKFYIACLCGKVIKMGGVVVIFMALVNLVIPLVIGG